MSEEVAERLIERAVREERLAEGRGLRYAITQVIARMKRLRTLQVPQEPITEFDAQYNAQGAAYDLDMLSEEAASAAKELRAAVVAGGGKLA